MHALLLDLNDFEGEHDMAIWYAAIAMNFGMHNATYRPLPGEGKATTEEEIHHSYYFRSQVDHPRSQHFNRMARLYKDRKGHGWLPRNKTYQRMIRHYEVYQNASREFEALDKYGFEKAEKKIPKDFNAFVFYSGARVNNFEMVHQATKILSENERNETSVSLLKERIEALKLHDESDNLIQVDNSVWLEHMTAFRQGFEHLAARLDATETGTRLSPSFFSLRHAQAEALVNDVDAMKLPHVKLRAKGTTVFISLYEGDTETERKYLQKLMNNRNYMIGVSDVILDFLGGLINSLAKSENEYFRIDRANTLRLSICNFVARRINSGSSWPLRLTTLRLVANCNTRVYVF